MRRRKTQRLYQLGFDAEFEGAVRQDVTPDGFTRLDFPDRGGRQQGRFVREVSPTFMVTSPAIIAEYLLEEVYAPFEDFDQEELWVHLLSTKHHLTHDVMVYRGTVNASTVRIAELFKEAVRQNAPVVVLSHCHPSGDATPSPEDARTTRMAVDGAKLLDLEVLDHIVVGDGRWVSMKERGLMDD